VTPFCIGASPIEAGVLQIERTNGAYWVFVTNEPHCPLSTSGNLVVMFDHYLERWDLTPDGEPIITPTSRILPVRSGGVPAMLKIAALDEEKLGNLLMIWWNWHGAARVLAHGEDAILMERAEDDASLADVARKRGDDEASRVICSVLANLHAPRGRPPPSVIPTMKRRPCRAA
jgi:streptomycin 6-kinase